MYIPTANFSLCYAGLWGDFVVWQWLYSQMNTLTTVWFCRGGQAIFIAVVLPGFCIFLGGSWFEKRRIWRSLPGFSPLTFASKKPHALLLPQVDFAALFTFSFFHNNVLWFFHSRKIYFIFSSVLFLFHWGESCPTLPLLTSIFVFVKDTKRKKEKEDFPSSTWQGDVAKRKKKHTKNWRQIQKLGDNLPEKHNE